MTRYYRHKNNNNVICSVYGGVARFSKWVWQGNYCNEVYNLKKVESAFYEAFEEVSINEFNSVWGVNLQNA
jgi:hypothetical protein